MKSKAGLTPEGKNLIRRYLIWCYKTTKESLERTSRKFTQLKVDQYVLERLNGRRGHPSQAYLAQVDDFKKYMQAKEAEAVRQKFTGPERDALNPQFEYLQNRLTAVEKGIKYFLGPRELVKISRLYEAEMTRRILEAREHQ